VKDGGDKPLPLLTNIANPRMNEGSSAEWKEVIDGMDHDGVYTIIQKDDLIQRIGENNFDRRKPNKKKEAKLIMLTDGVNTCDELFQVGNFYSVEDAIKQMCQGEVMKAGLNVALGTLLKTSADVLISHFTILRNKDKCEEITSFKRVLKTNYPKMFVAAEYQLKETRQRGSRKPAALPDEEDLDKLRNYLISQIDRFDSIKSKRDYVQLRRLVMVRLTLLNSRRGSESAHLLVRDFSERHSWIDLKKLNQNRKQLLKKCSITYVMQG
jgi:hypothetical protein